MAVYGSFWVLLGSVAAIASACGSSDAAKQVTTKYAGGGEGGDGEATHASGAGRGDSQAGETSSTPAGAGGGAGPTGDGAGGATGGVANGDAGAGGEAGGGVCFGDPCSCVQQVHGSAVVRADGHLLLLESGAQRVVRDAASGLALDHVTSAWPGQYMGCAVRSDGSVWCWANQSDGDSQGLLGTGTPLANVTPYWAYQVQVEPKGATPEYLSDVRSFQSGATAGGGSVPCAVTHSGAVYCWGPMLNNGNLAQTGQNEPYARQIKTSKDVFVSGAVELAVGYRHACYTNAQGKVLCWGMNIGGPLGNGSEDGALYPAPVSALSGVSKLVAGYDFTCALVGSGAEAGRVFCWGAGTFGTLGIGTPADNADVCATTRCKRTPTRVRTGSSSYLDDVVDLASAQDMTCALRRDRSVWCWGGVAGNYAAELEAPAGTPLPDVGLLSVHGIEPRVLLTNGVYDVVEIGKTRTSVTVNCGALD